MSGLWSLAWQSAWSRRYGLSWVVLSIALATFLMLVLVQMRQDVREHFSQSVSGTDLIVGARTSGTALLLYSVFHIGQPSNNIRWSSAQAIAQDPAVAWVIPISLGDSLRGYPVVGTERSFFEHFRYGQKQALKLSQGRVFENVFEAVLGAEVAQQLRITSGQRIALNHGSGALEEGSHADKPFSVVGVLARTGTPIDRSVFISLAGMQAIHIDWLGGMPARERISAEQALQADLRPSSVTALLVGLKSRAGVFSMQRSINQFQPEPLMAVLPGVALDELWSVLAVGERVLESMVLLVGLISLLALVATVGTALEQRRQELAVLRSLGAGPRRIFALLLMEGAWVTGCAAILAWIASLLAIAAASPWLAAHFGLALQTRPVQTEQVLVLVTIMLGGTLASAIPGWRAYRLSITDGLQPRA